MVNYTIFYWIYKFSLETKLENTWKRKGADLNPIWPAGPARGAGASALRWPNRAQDRDARVWWHSCKRDHVLFCNSTNTIHTIPLVNIFANRPLDVVAFTTGRSLDSPALDDTAADGSGQLRWQPRLAKTGVRGRPLPKAKRAWLGSG